MQTGDWQFELARWWPLALLLTAPVVVYYARQSLSHFPRWQRNVSAVLRSLLLVVLAVALCGPEVISPTHKIMVVAAVDRSASIPDEGKQGAAEFVAECNSLTAQDSLRDLPFAGVPFDELAGGDERGTDLAAAIAAAAAGISDEHVPRIVLLSDGRPTAGDALAAARASGCPIDVVPLPGRPAAEVYLSDVAAPPLVDAGEPFFVALVVYSSSENHGTLVLKRADSILHEEQVDLRPGENRFRFPVVIPRPSVAILSAELLGFDDILPENNQARTAVFPGPRPRVLLVESRPVMAEPLRNALVKENIEVEVRRPEELPADSEALEAFELLMLSDVPATALAEGRMEAIERYVGASGGGLIVVGGERAFTPGGYRDTMLEQILPVRPHARTDRPKPSVALVIVLDRSGSMEGESIELARLATRKAVENLTPRDLVGVVAFEDRTHWVSRVEKVEDKQQVLRRIETIEAGGGTDMVPAMRQAYLALDEAFAERKHMIVLSDGLSHPGDFHGLAKKIADAGITISTVAVGAEAAGKLLRDVAAVGDGNFYACKDATAVPQIFVLETIAAGKLGIREEPFLPRVVHPSQTLAGLDFGEVKPLLGYAETKLKPTAQLILAGEDGDPLLAWWRYGAGTTVAFTSDIQSRWAAAWLDWEGFGRFWAQTVRHAMRRDAARDFSLSVERCGGRAKVTVDAVDPQGRFVNAADGVLTVIGHGTRSQEMPFKQIAPGRYRAEFAASRLGMYYLEASLRYEGRVVYLARQGFSVDFPDELRVGPTNTALLRAIAETSGGRYDPSPAEVFAPDGRFTLKTCRLWPPLLVAVLLLFLIDVGLKRIEVGGKKEEGSKK